uniref:Reverse transcriptase RNase H-like domain-containing protein n=1 Tax=Setaria italica TaxID=4555 RepID=K3ZER5_SETIT
MNEKKALQQFLGIVNYARNYIENLAKLARPLYAKLRKNGQKHFNSQDIKLVRIIKEKDAILKQKPHKYFPKIEEKICRYASGKYKLKAINNTDREILAVINAINAFTLYLGFKEFTVRTDCEAICRYYNKINRMKKGVSPTGIDCFCFGAENKLRIFPPNTYKFKPRDHIVLDENPRIYVSFEQVIAQKIEKDKDGGILWKKYTDIDQALTYARNILGPSSSGINIKEEGSSKAPTYKEVLKKEGDPSNEEYIDNKLKENLESVFPQWKNNLKEEIMKEIRLEIDEKFKNMQKDYELKMDIPISDDDMMDFRGDSQE